MREKLKNKKNNGITLIALVITIIVLLILAGVTIATLTGENGILTKANDAAIQTELSEIEEAANLIYTSKLMGNTYPQPDITMEDIVNQLQTDGYEIATAVGNNITGIKLDSNSLTVEKGATISITVTYEGNADGMQYYAVVRGKYYLMTMTDNGIIVSREPTNIEDSEGNILTAISSNESVVKVEEIRENIIELKVGNAAGKTAKITVNYGEYTAECIVTVVTTPTEDSEPNAGISFSTSYGTIDVIWLTEENQVSSEPNAPVLSANNETMTPVTWSYDENSQTWTEDETADISNWYNYNPVSNRDENGPIDNTTSKWANAKTANGSYFVWIPRYAYRITYYDATSSTEPTGFYDGWGMWKNDGTLKYKLDEGIETVDYNGNKYIIHPAFCDGSSNGYVNGEWDEDLAGFWFAKYEMSRNSSNLQSVPDIASLRNEPIGDQYVEARNATYGYTGTQNTITSGGTEYNHTSFMDSHLAKNSEWGAVAYLTQSQYGRNGNEIDTNNSRSFITGNGDGAVGGDVSSVSGTANAYNTEIGAKASTTGNIYGIYDMAGGTHERTADFNKLGSSSYLANFSYGLKMTREAKDGEGNYISTKYITTYSNSSNSSMDNAYAICKIGDAIKEVRTNNSSAVAWFSDNSYFAYTSGPFFGRGGDYTSNNGAGVFCSRGSLGNSVGNESFRTVLCP